ncbi:unnamed protein product [Paramecium pentaurelia]|uniref:Uncharacterized protein n=1 Tax=Paramecium pentaurelia TaxID=43138 RepID=A0A8S1WS72_9CILI|nr:unnamed protein product [Paramecium pentaurelia]CAD8191660.1 unnamed protein product [Paramecium pentaurelia]
MNFGKPRSGSSGSTWEKLKKSVYPTNKAEREKRKKQFLDVAIFVASIVVVSVFEKRIQTLLKVDKSELTQFSNMQQSMHAAY